MTTLANAGSEGTLATEKGHHFASMASFPWRDPVNGPRVQDSEIIVALQSKELGRHKYIAIEGKIELNSHLHTSAQRFKLDSFEITVSALHGNSNPPHPIQCDQMSPGSGPNSQSAHPFTTGTVWFQRIDNSTQKTFGGFLGSFAARFVNCCSVHAGCSASDPTSLSITINVTLSDSNPATSSKTLAQTVRIVYPDWPTLDESSFAGEMIHTTYDTNFAGSEVKGIATVRDAWNTNKLPQGISYTMEVNRRRNSGFWGHRAASKIVGTVNTIGRTLKILGKQVRRPSRVLDMMYDRSGQSGSNTKQS